MSESSHAKSKTPLLSDRNYKVIKYVASIVLPAVATLYFALAQIWSLPKAEEVIGSIAAINAFFGVILGISTRSYNNSNVAYDGTLKLDGSGMAGIELHHKTESEVIDKGIAILKIDSGD